MISKILYLFIGKLFIHHAYNNAVCDLIIDADLNESMKMV